MPMALNSRAGAAPPDFDLPVVPSPDAVSMKAHEVHIELAALPAALMPAPIRALLLLALEIVAALLAL
jgi:hypothetical protein